MAATHKTTESELKPYITALATHGRKLPQARGSSGPSLKPTGVQVRSKQPNVETPNFFRGNGRPPAEHIVRMLVKRMTTDGIKYKPGGNESLPHFKNPVVHPGKALALKKVKALHLSKPSVKKVSL